jgi:hypothetical protein
MAAKRKLSKCLNIIKEISYFIYLNEIQDEKKIFFVNIEIYSIKNTFHSFRSKPLLGNKKSSQPEERTRARKNVEIESCHKLII